MDGPGQPRLVIGLSALVAQRWQDARDRTTSTTEQLAARYGVPRRTGFTVPNVAVNGNHGHYSAFTDIEFTTADGPTTTHIPLVADGSRWRPCP